MIGKLRHEITIQEVVRVEDGQGGFSSEGWTTFGPPTVWAKITPLSSREIFFSQSMQARVTHKIIVRDFPGITSAMRVKFGERYFHIKGTPRNFEERGIYTEIIAEEGAPT